MADLKNIPDYVPGHGLLKGKRVVVTAAAGTGIGFAAAKKCIEEGAQVFISDIHEGRLQKAQDKLEAEVGQRPDYAICNVTQQTDVDNLIQAAAKSLGGIDVVINNAGLGGTANLVDMTDEQWNAPYQSRGHAIYERQWRRRYRQQRFGLGVARAKRSGPLCGSQSRRYGADTMRRCRRGGIWGACERRRAEPGAPSVFTQSHI